MEFWIPFGTKGTSRRSLPAYFFNWNGVGDKRHVGTVMEASTCPRKASLQITKTGFFACDSHDSPTVHANRPNWGANYAGKWEVLLPPLPYLDQGLFYVTMKRWRGFKYAYHACQKAKVFLHSQLGQLMSPFRQEEFKPYVFRTGGVAAFSTVFALEGGREGGKEWAIITLVWKGKSPVHSFFFPSFDLSVRGGYSPWSDICTEVGTTLKEKCKSF